MIVRWTPTAFRDLDSLHSYVAADNVRAANALVETIVRGVASLSLHPASGRSGRVAGTRELVVSPYVIAYRVRRNVVEVLAIIHGARRWPDAF